MIKVDISDVCWSERFKRSGEMGKTHYFILMSTKSFSHRPHGDTPNNLKLNNIALYFILPIVSDKISTYLIVNDQLNPLRY